MWRTRTAGQNRELSRPQTREAAHAAPGHESRVSTFDAKTGPNTRVIGVIISDGPGRPVTHARLAPVGAKTTCVRNGFRWCEIAWGHHTRSQAYSFASFVPTPAQVPEGFDRTGNPKSTIDTPRYRTKAIPPCVHRWSRPSRAIPDRTALSN
jgi:hypothetical protein